MRPVLPLQVLSRLPRLRHVNVHGTGVQELEQLAAGAGGGLLGRAQVVPPWVLGRL